MKYDIFEGNEKLIHLFYRSILLNEAVPVSPEEGLQSVLLMDKIWSKIDNNKTEYSQ